MNQKNTDKEKLLEKIIVSTLDIPSLPLVAQKVLLLINNDNASIDSLEELISKDQAFSTRVLRIANSPFYGKRHAINTISGAIMLIGFNTMKSLVIGASLRDINRKFGAVEKSLWLHSRAVSIAASMLAQETKKMPAEEALVAGLVHDVGRTVINNTMQDQYAVISDSYVQHGIPLDEAERKAFGFTHGEVGGYISRKWQFPKNLEIAIEYHHEEKFPSFLDESFEPIYSVMKAADSMCLRLGIGMKQPETTMQIDYGSIGIDEKKFNEMTGTIKQICSEPEFASS